MHGCMEETYPYRATYFNADFRFRGNGIAPNPSGYFGRQLVSSFHQAKVFQPDHIPAEYLSYILH